MKIKILTKNKNLQTMVFNKPNTLISPSYLDLLDTSSDSSYHNKTFFLDFPIMDAKTLIEYLTYHQIEKLSINYLYNFHLIPLPNCILVISFNSLSNFNNPINNLPCYLKVLELSDDFNQDIDYLPPTLEILILGFRFNKKIDNLPVSLKKLELGHAFNQEIHNLPNQLQTLKLNIQFNKTIDHLPDSIESLVIIGSFDQEIKKLPNNLELLDLSLTKFQNSLSAIKTLPRLKTLIINSKDEFVQEIASSNNLEIVLWNNKKYKKYPS